MPAAPRPASVRPWSWWSSSSPGAYSCSPTSPRNSTWRALPWCWGPHSSVASAGPSPRCSCRRRNLVRAGCGPQAGWKQARLGLTTHARPHSTGLQNPIDTMFHLQPLMFLGLFPLFAIFEGTLGRPSWGPLGAMDPPPCSEASSVVAAEVTKIKGAVRPLAEPGRRAGQTLNQMAGIQHDKCLHRKYT